MAIFTAGVVLLLGIWGAKRSNLSTDPKKGMSEVHRCMKALKAMENRWQPAGRVWCVVLFQGSSPSALTRLFPGIFSTNSPLWENYHYLNRVLLRTRDENMNQTLRLPVAASQLGIRRKCLGPSLVHSRTNLHSLVRSNDRPSYSNLLLTCLLTLVPPSFRCLYTVTNSEDSHYGPSVRKHLIRSHKLIHSRYILGSIICTPYRIV